MDMDRINYSTIAAADLILAKIEHTIHPPAIPLEKIRAALFPLFGIQWVKQANCGLAANRPNALLQKLHNMGLDTPNYDKLTSPWQDACAVSTAHPTDWVLFWIPLIQRFRLHARFSWPTLYEPRPAFRRKGYSSPGGLALLPASIPECASACTSRLCETRALWGVARAVFTKHAEED